MRSGTVIDLSVEPFLPQPGGFAFADRRGVVRRVVENLNLQLLPRVIQLAHRADQTLDDVGLIEDRQLDRDERQLVELRLRFGDVLPMLPVEEDHDETMHTITRETEDNDGVTDNPKNLRPLHELFENGGRASCTPVPVGADRKLVPPQASRKFCPQRLNSDSVPMKAKVRFHRFDFVDGLDPLKASTEVVEFGNYWEHENF